MSIYTYGIGGNEVKLDASEGIADIPSNKTLLVQKLTEEDSPTPELVYNLKTVEDVFEKFKPQVDVEFETAAGESKKEELAFKNLGDFNAKNIIQKSDFLNDLSIQQEQYNKMARQLASNKVLQKALSDPNTRAAVLAALQNAITEIEEAGK